MSTWGEIQKVGRLMDDASITYAKVDCNIVLGFDVILNNMFFIPSGKSFNVNANDVLERINHAMQ